MRYLKTLYKHASRSTPITFDAMAVQIAQDNCKSWIANPNVTQLWRSRNWMSLKQAPYILSNPAAEERFIQGSVARFGILSEADGWDAYPKRNMSIMASTAQNGAAAFSGKKDRSDMYLVIPYDGANIGVCPNNDFNDAGAFFNVEKNIDDGTSSLSSLIYDINSLYGITTGQSAPTFDKVLEVLTFENYAAATKDRTLSTLKKFIRYAETTGWTALQAFYFMTSPQQNGYDQNGYPNVTYMAKSNREFWTDSQCLLVNFSAIEELCNFLQIPVRQ